MFIVFEGIDGAGKSTLTELTAQWLEDVCPTKKILTTHEPYRSSSPEPGIDPLLWYCIDRQYHIRDYIAPALKRGDIVLCDRYYHSTAAYQSEGGDLWMSHAIAQRFAQKCIPDMFFWVRTPPEIAIERRPNEAYRRLCDLDVNYLLIMNFRKPYPVHCICGEIPLERQLQEVQSKIRVVL